MKARAREEYLATLGPYAGFPDAIRAALPRDGVWVRDVTIANSTWGNRVFPIYDPQTAVHPVGAAIGPGLALGIGASIAAEGRKTIAMCGDGGFSLGMCELWTVAQEKPDLVTMVMNDGGYGVIRHIQDAVADGRQFGHDLLTPDFGALAALAGLPFFKVMQRGEHRRGGGAGAGGEGTGTGRGGHARDRRGAALCALCDHGQACGTGGAIARGRSTGGCGTASLPHPRRPQCLPEPCPSGTPRMSPGSHASRRERPGRFIPAIGSVRSAHSQAARPRRAFGSHSRAPRRRMATLVAASPSSRRATV